MPVKAPTTPVTALNNVSNAAEADVLSEVPYFVRLKIEGTAALLCHAWNNEAVAEKAVAKKGSVAKKTDNVESYVYRNPNGEICLPGRYLIGSMVDPRNGAAKYRQDPRSPRKSALDLYKAGVVSETELAPLHSIGSNAPALTWDYLDSQRVMVQRQGVTRVRPAFLAGWTAEFTLLVLSPEYISAADLLACLSMAGRLVGVGDFRPSYGRFQITSFEVGLID